MTDETYSSWLHEIGCCFPGECCMAHVDHFRHECYTPEMAEAEDREYIVHLERLNDDFRKRISFAREILAVGNLDLATEEEAKEAIAGAMAALIGTDLDES